MQRQPGPRAEPTVGAYLSSESAALRIFDGRHSTTAHSPTTHTESLLWAPVSRHCGSTTGHQRLRSVIGCEGKGDLDPRLSLSRGREIIQGIYTRTGIPRWCSGKESCQSKRYVWSLGWEDPLEKEMATHFNILAWDRDLVVYTSWGHKRVGHDLATKKQHQHSIRNSLDLCSWHGLRACMGPPCFSTGPLWGKGLHAGMGKIRT